MSEKRCYFVMGAESSGTRMMTRALILAGCYEDTAWHNARAAPDLSGAPDLIAVHRSLPHSITPRVWPNLNELMALILRSGYVITPILMVRDWHATISSQQRREWFDEDAAANIRRAIRDVVTTFADFVPVTYEAFCFSEQFRIALFADHFGLPKTPIDIWYANEKHYDPRGVNL